MPPLVTVIITVFKRIEFLPQAINSVLAQTFDSYEILVTDDANNPSTRSICESLNKTGKIRYRSNSERLGVALNLRAAILEAQGKYLAILNDDDFWKPDFLKDLVEPLEKDSRRVLAFSDHWIIREDSKIDREKTQINTKAFRRDVLSEGELNNTVELALNKTIPLCQACIFRKEALNVDLLDCNVAGAYDFWISCLLAATGRPFFYKAKRLSLYRIHFQMETYRITPNKFQPEVFIFRTLLENNYFPEWKRFLQQKLGRMLFRHGKAQLVSNFLKEARILFIQSMYFSPHWKPVVGLFASYLPGKARYLLIQN